ncbi:MAG: helix-turn-helix transcriptional regulator [Lachnospiraceae bacterium]|jgi:transcriptional regulator with XRE-family HTH domain|nr:helix-turn-helix transcriptional regulator [Lachnospiraceae bacterium]
MGEYLQGTLQQRMRELREARDYSQAKVAGILGIDKASYGRMENGTTRTVNSDVLTGLANLYEVSSDYLLGISDVPQKTYYDLKALGLSVEAAASLLTKNANQEVVDALLRNENFLEATRLMATYFSEIAVIAFATGNSVYDFSYDLATEFINRGRIPKNGETDALRARIKSKRARAEPMELNNIRKYFMAAVDDIRKETGSEVREYAKGKFTSEILDAVRAEIERRGDPLALPFEQRKRNVIESVKAGLRENPDVYDEYGEKLDEAVEVIMPALFDLWK